MGRLHALRVLVPIEQRFWAKVDKRGDDACWPWLGGTNTQGYGTLGKGITDRRRGVSDYVYAHRFSYELHCGPVPVLSRVRHICGDKRCVNPQHLVLFSNNAELPRRPVHQRFWEKVERRGDDECWGWTGAKHPKGYGVLGSGGDRGPNVLAHRLSYELHHGPIPPGTFVLHSCDTPECTNPQHLHLGGPADNSGEMVERSRQRRGDNHQTAKLTSAQVLAIRARIAAWSHPPGSSRAGRPKFWGAESFSAIAREYGVGEATVRDIHHRRIWTHI